MGTEEHDVAPGRGCGQLVFQGEVAATTEVKMERLKGRSLEDPAQRAERALPGLSFLGSIPAGEILKLGDEARTVVSYTRSEALDRDDHRTCRVSAARH